ARVMPGHFDASFIDTQSDLRRTLYKAALKLGELRKTSEIRDYLLTLLFTISNADRTAVLVDHSLWELKRGETEPAAAVADGVIDQVMKEGTAFVSTDGPPSIACVPMEKSGNRLGAIYMESSDAETPLTLVQAFVLTGMAPIAANAF